MDYYSKNVTGAHARSVYALLNAAIFYPPNSLLLEFFAGICELIEAIVLYDKIILPKDSSHAQYVNDILPGVFELVDYPCDIDSRCGDCYNENKMSKELRIDCLFPYGDLWGVNHKKLINTDNTLVYSLQDNYNNLSKQLLNFREQMSLGFCNPISINMPPIPLQLFSLLQSPNEFVQKLLVLRDEYSKLRFQMSKLREILADDSVTPKKKAKYYTDWVQRWNMANKHDGISFLQIAQGTLGMYDANIDFTDELLLGNSVSIVKFVDWLLSWSRNQYYSWDIRLMRKSAKKYINTSNNEIINHLARVYSIPKEELMVFVKHKIER